VDGSVVRCADGTALLECRRGAVATLEVRAIDGVALLTSAFLVRFEDGTALPTSVVVVEVRDAWDFWGWVERFADGFEVRFVDGTTLLDFRRGAVAVLVDRTALQISTFRDSGRGSVVIEVRAAWECFMECWGSLLDFWRIVSATIVAVASANVFALLSALTALRFASSRKRASAMGQATISVGWPGMWKYVRTALRICLGWSSESWGYAPMEMIQPFLAFMRCLVVDQCGVVAACGVVCSWRHD